MRVFLFQEDKMKKIGIFVDKLYKNNRYFNEKSRDDCLYPMVVLRDKFKTKGYELSTYDMYPADKFDLFLFSDMPDFRNKDFQNIIHLRKPLYLILTESEIIKPENWDIKKHILFEKIFTWNDSKVDGRKYIKFFLANKIPDIFEIDLSTKKKLCVMITANKMNYDKRELYSERLNAVEWFNNNHTEDFDLYGIDWEKGVWIKQIRKFLRNKIIRKIFKIIEKINFFRGLFKKNLIVYRGTIPEKRAILSRYKFSICFENARNIPGYITEKIFDSFFAGCIPIYLGAPNIKNFIPENTFIDWSRFKNYAELYNYIKQLSDNEYENYLRNIQSFIKSKQMRFFSAEFFAETIIKNIIPGNEKDEK